MGLRSRLETALDDSQTAHPVPASNSMDETGTLPIPAPVGVSSPAVPAVPAPQQFNTMSTDVTANGADIGHMPVVPPVPQPAPGPELDARGRKVGSGRPAGVQCKCKCCGALGFYKRSCGRKHQCLIGKCHGMGEAGDAGVAASAAPGDPSAPTTMYQVLCASCGVPLQFALPNHPAYIVCYNCNAKMVIQPMQDQAAGESADGAAAEGQALTAPSQSALAPADVQMLTTRDNIGAASVKVEPPVQNNIDQPMISATMNMSMNIPQVGEKRAREEDEPVKDETPTPYEVPQVAPEPIPVQADVPVDAPVAN